ncbi:MAG: hypothetical protein KTR17_01830 [Cellvibrionaceae bacterium]|nr:hypothetical protein [Cellvibrionaceae bacterium]
MNKQQPVLLFLLVVYVLFPSLVDWIIDAEAGWYRPYIFWSGLVIVAYILQRRDSSHDL